MNNFKLDKLENTLLSKIPIKLHVKFVLLISLKRFNQID